MAEFLYHVPDKEQFAITSPLSKNRLLGTSSIGDKYIVVPATKKTVVYALTVRLSYQGVLKNLLVINAQLEGDSERIDRLVTNFRAEFAPIVRCVNMDNQHV